MQHTFHFTAHNICTGTSLKKSFRVIMTSTPFCQPMTTGTWRMLSWVITYLANPTILMVNCRSSQSKQTVVIVESLYARCSLCNVYTSSIISVCMQCTCRLQLPSVLLNLESWTSMYVNVSIDKRLSVMIVVINKQPNSKLLRSWLISEILHRYT